jgi:methyl coenzyme M reductase subunit D
MWWEKLKVFNGDRVKNLCSAERVLNRVEDLKEVRRLLIKIS